MVWQGDYTACGRFAIVSEHVRGEPRWYWLGYNGSAVSKAAAALGVDGSTDKRAVRRQAQRVADHLAEQETTPV